MTFDNLAHADVLLRLFDPLAIVLVAGGSVAAAALQAGQVGTVAAFRALSALRGKFREPAVRATMARLRRVAARDGLLAIERHAFADRAIGRTLDAIVDGVRRDGVEMLLAEEREARGRRHARAAEFWVVTAEAAPAMGMIGTILGLIGMFSALHDIGRIGPSLALALVTTFWGAVISNLVAGPIAGRLARLHGDEEAARLRIEAELLALAPVEHPVAVARAGKRAAA